ncbi:MAG: hypothetical protein Q9164_003215 [Protoblastenia rupestris]
MPRKSKLPNIHAGGYYPAKTKQLKDVKLPPQSIKYFSNKQCDNLRNGMASGRVNNPEGKWILCQDCTGTQRTEMECCICGQWKGLDGFAKAQRKNSEHARCSECVSDHQQTPVMQENAVQDLLNTLDSGSDDSDSDDGGSFVTNRYDNSGLGSTRSGVSIQLQHLEKMSIDDRNRDASGGRGSPKALDSTSGRNTHGSAQAASAISTWNAAAQSSGATSSQPNVGQGFTGYDSQGQAHKLARSESSVDSEESFAETVLSARAEKNARSAFAKHNEVGSRGIPHIRPAPYNAGRNVDYDSGSDGDPDFGQI